MDVVREFVVEKLKGSLDVESELGQGHDVPAHHPAHARDHPRALLRVGDQMFALPTGSIEETLRIDPGEIIKVEGREVIRRQRRTIPLVRLADILGVPRDRARRGQGARSSTIGFSGHRMGFIVDAFVGEQQIVIKPLGTHLKQGRQRRRRDDPRRGRGRADPQRARPDGQRAHALRAAGRAGAARSSAQGPRTILICEDSFTTRELERSIFEAAGYDVETAMDGAHGPREAHARASHVDAVVTDVQMPNMTGFELTQGDQVRRDARATSPSSSSPRSSATRRRPRASRPAPTPTSPSRCSTKTRCSTPSSGSSGRRGRT